MAVFFGVSLILWPQRWEEGEGDIKQNKPSHCAHKYGTAVVPCLKLNTKTNTQKTGFLDYEKRTGEKEEKVEQREEGGGRKG